MKRERLSHSVRTVGLVTADKGRQWMYVPRTDGYVQKLYVTSPGQTVETGQALLQVYSPDLATSEQELIKLLENRDRGTSRDIDLLIQSAKRRLRQWNLTEQQIEELEKSRLPSESLTLLSPFRGVVEDVPADQGARFSMGQKLISVADLSLVWVWAEFYQNEIPMIHAGQVVSITFDSAKSLAGVIAVVNPFVSPAQRTTKVRIDLPNPDLQLRPGMYVNADLSVDLGEGLTVPINAVVPTGSRNIVFLDKGNGKLPPSAVQLGSRVGDAYQVLSGLKEGDRVVTSAIFLIDAESQVQGALEGFEQESTAPSPEEATPQNGLGKSLVAKIEYKMGPPLIRSEDGQLVGFVFVDIESGDVDGYVRAAAQRISEQVKFPPGYYIQWAGQFQYLREAEQRLAVVIPFTLLIIFVLIFLNTRSAIKTMIVMLAVPFSLVGAFWMLYLLHYNMSVAVWVGLIALAGLDAETGVVMLLYLDQAWEKFVAEGRMRSLSDLYQAVQEGAVQRIRPKIMTVSAILFGLLPILWSPATQAGADVMKRIATPMIGGVITSAILELLIYPVIYVTWRKRSLVD